MYAVFTVDLIESRQDSWIIHNLIR